MIAVTLLNHLAENLNVGVYFEAPKTLTDYVLIDQTGSNRQNHITTTTFAIQSYADSLYAAMELNERVREAMTSLVALNEIASVDLETDYNFTDTDSKQYRWQAVYQITHY